MNLACGAAFRPLRGLKWRLVALFLLKELTSILGRGAHLNIIPDLTANMRITQIAAVLSSLTCLAAESTGEDERHGKHGKCKKEWVDSETLQADISTEKYTETDHFMIVHC
jgi:hypothetical protein